MDDFNENVLSEAKNEYASRLINILTPLVIEGFRSILKEACDLCLQNEEESKYLMTFQNFLTRVPKWNQEIINIETKRIIETSKCHYLEDLLTCVHITQLKVLTSIRVASQQKKIDIDIPKLENFIHKIYVESARKIYQNVYLFENDVMPLIQQKNMREAEIIVKESILNVIRNSMPIEQILRSYIDETQEEEVFEEVVEDKQPEKELIKENVDETPTNNIDNTETIGEIKKVDDTKIESFEDTPIETKIETPTETPTETNFETPTETQIETPIEIKKQGLSFNDKDNIVKFSESDSPDAIKDVKSNLVTAPKTIERLEEISEQRYNKRKEEEEEEEDEDDFKLKIFDESPKLNLDSIDIHDLNKDNSIKLNDITELKGVELLS